MLRWWALVVWGRCGLSGERWREGGGARRWLLGLFELPEEVFEFGEGIGWRWSGGRGKGGGGGGSLAGLFAPSGFSECAFLVGEYVGTFLRLILLLDEVAKPTNEADDDK